MDKLRRNYSKSFQHVQDRFAGEVGQLNFRRRSRCNAIWTKSSEHVILQSIEISGVRVHLPGRHAYGGTDTDFATRLVIGFIIANLLWGTLAVLRLILKNTIADSQAYVNRR